MAEKDKDGKLTYKMVSPGEAFMNFTNSKEGHNAAAVTPEYLKEAEKKSAFEQALDKARQEKAQVKTEPVSKQQEMSKEQAQTIDKSKVKNQEKER